MARLPEQRLWDTMRRNKPPQAWLQRMENAVGSGMGDVYAVGLCDRGEDCSAWVELKAPRRPRRASTPLMGDKQGLRKPSQVNWHMKAAAQRMRTYVLIRDNHKELFLIAGWHADTVNQMSVQELRDISLASNWPDIFEELF